jgi:hypothetical protein
MNKKMWLFVGLCCWLNCSVGWMHAQEANSEAETSVNQSEVTKQSEVFQPSEGIGPSEEKSRPKSQDRKLKRKKAEKLQFLRVQKEQQGWVALQTAVVTYANPADADGPKITLIGAVHVGQKQYYAQLNQTFQKYDALLYELVMDPAAGVPDPSSRGISPVSTIQVGLKEALGLAFQLDEIDYASQNFVHADMTPEQFETTLKTRKEGMWQMFFRSIGSAVAMQSTGQSSDMDVLSAMLSKNRTVGLRRALAQQMSDMDGQMAALTGEDGKSTLITERNAKAFEVLDQQLELGKTNLAIFYGAAHLEDMHARLIKQYQLQPVEVQWLDAWDLRD